MDLGGRDALVAVLQDRSEYRFDRGTPIDRFYIERFLAANADAIHGDVLEVKDSTYTDLFGFEARSHVLDLNALNKRATIIADLSEPGSLPVESFDCFICTQTLQYVRDPRWAVGNAVSCLRDGGTLLLTVPTATRIDTELATVDRWRFTPTGLLTLLGRGKVWGYGNQTTTVAFLAALVAEELEPDDLITDDPAFPTIAVARVDV